MTAPMMPTQFVEVDLDSNPYALAARIQQELMKNLTGTPEQVDKVAFREALEQVVHFATLGQEAMNHQLNPPAPANAE